MLPQERLPDERAHRMREQRDRYFGIGLRHHARDTPRIVDEQPPSVRIAEMTEIGVGRGGQAVSAMIVRPGRNAMRIQLGRKALVSCAVLRHPVQDVHACARMEDAVPAMDWRQGR